MTTFARAVWSFVIAQETPLEIAIANGFVEIVRLLTEAQAQAESET
jgi:ankyrin repeat protein